MKTRILLTMMILSGCQANAVKPDLAPVSHEPNEVKWLTNGCELYGALELPATEEVLVFQVPVDYCARGA